MQITTKQLFKKLITYQKQNGGHLPWREFMRVALYDPDFGYYSNSIRHIGLRGDFTTAPVLSSLVARMVYFWQSAKRKKNSALEHAPFIEIGAGNGEFASQFLRSRPFWNRHKPYWIVETSPPLKKLQQSLLRNRKVRWFESVSDALEESAGCAILFSNELVDAFPCSRWIYSDSQWMECGIRIADGKVFDTLFSSPLPNSTIFENELLSRQGQYVETHESYRDWLSSWSPLARRAAMLTIDYGTTSRNLFTNKTRGSLRAYWQQQRLEGSSIYSRIGRQDLTADVNFSDLEKWSAISGWNPHTSIPLADWLRMQLEESGGKLHRTLPGSAESRLLDLEDAGGAFMVFECEKD